jgi:hypothetical protein
LREPATDGGAIILEERGSELILKPAMVLELEMYSEAGLLRGMKRKEPPVE